MLLKTNNEQKSARITGCNYHFRYASFGFSALFLLLVPYNKQLNNLDHSALTGKSQTSAHRIDLAIARSIRQGLSLRFSRNDLPSPLYVLCCVFVYSVCRLKLPCIRLARGKFELTNQDSAGGKKFSVLTSM